MPPVLFHFLCSCTSVEAVNGKTKENSAVKKSAKESTRFSFWHRVKVKTADFADFFKSDLKPPSWLFSTQEKHSGSYRTCQLCISFSISSTFFLISVELLRSLFSCYKIYDIRKQVLTCAPCFLKFHLFLCISRSSERKNLKTQRCAKVRERKSAFFILA